MTVQAYRSTLPLVIQWLFLAWRWLVAFPLTVISLLFMGPLMVLVGLVKEEGAFTVAKLWTRFECLISFTWLKTHGMEHVKPGQGYVIMTNHQSAMDFTLIVGIPIRMRYVMKAELRKVPLFGWASNATGTVWIDRSNREKAFESLDAMRPKLEEGISLQIFPEGTRSKDGSLGPFKKGGFMLALQLGVPILPVTISGSGKVWPPNTWAPLPGTIDYIIHEPIDVTKYGMERRDELMQAVREALEAGLPSSF